MQRVNAYQLLANRDQSFHINSERLLLCVAQREGAKTRPQKQSYRTKHGHCESSHARNKNIVFERKQCSARKHLRNDSAQQSECKANDRYP